jgi:hypothetical protein
MPGGITEPPLSLGDVTTGNGVSKGTVKSGYESFVALTKERFS